MKYLFSVDIEGISGVVAPKQGSMDSKEYERARKLMTEEANAAATGAFDAGAEQVIINDSHGKMRNIIVEDLDERVELISGRPKVLSMMEGLEEDIGGVGFVGYHGSSGSYGTLSHTYSGSVVDVVKIDDMVVGEFALNSFLAGEKGIPIFFISGDQEAIREAKELYRGIPHVLTKTSKGRYSAKLRHPEVIRKEIREVVKENISLGKRKVIATKETALEVRFKDAGMVDNLELLPSIERTGPKEFLIDTGDFDTNYKVFRASTILAAKS